MDLGGGTSDVELVAELRPPRRRFGLLAVNVAVIAVALFGVYVLAAKDDPEVAPPETTDPATSTTTPTVDQLLAIMPASPIDGKQSQRLPVAVTPAFDVVDGQVVTVLAKGFQPAERVGVVMCVADAALDGVQACDLGTGFDGVTYAEATREGFVQVDVLVRQLITTPLTGAVDCASSAERCLLAAGAVGDYDRSGGASIGFLGEPPFPVPSLTVSVPGPYEPGQLVDVAAAGLLAPREAELQICQADRCVRLLRGRVAADGTIASPVVLPWSFVLDDGAVVTCDIGCELRLGYLALPGSTRAPTPAAIAVEFTTVDPAAPPVPATVAPTTVALTTVPAPDAPAPTAAISTVPPIDDVSTTILAVVPTTSG